MQGLLRKLVSNQNNQEGKFMQGYHQLQIAAVPDNWRLFSIRKNDKNFSSFRQQIFIRDSYTCCYCGLQSKQHQEVVNLDNNYSNNKSNNLVTACCFCAQCLFLEAIGRENNGGGTLIYLPEISQTNLNIFCHVLFWTISSKSGYVTDALEIYDSLCGRAKIVEQHFGEGMSKAAFFGRMLIDISNEDRSKLEKEVIPLLRLLPLSNKFTGILGDWSKSIVQELSV